MEEEMMENREIPKWVNVLGLLYTVLGGIFFYMAFGSFFGLQGSLEAALTQFYYFLPLGIILLFTGVYLRKGKNWARILGIILSSLVILGVIIPYVVTFFQGGLFSINLSLTFTLLIHATSLITVFLNIYIIKYLLIDRVKAFFNQN